MSDEQMFKAIKQYEQIGEVVQCVECRHWGKRKEANDKRAWCDMHKGFWYYDEYCSYGDKGGDLNDKL